MFYFGLLVFLLIFKDSFSQDGKAIGINCDVKSDDFILTACVEETGFFDFCFLPDPLRCTESCPGRCLIDDFSEITSPCFLTYRFTFQILTFFALEYRYFLLFCESDSLKRPNFLFCFS